MASLEFLLDHALRTRVAPLLWGPPGVGKSAAIVAWAKKRGLRCWTVLASVREPADFGGLPILGAPVETGIGSEPVPSVGFAPPRFALEAARDGGVIFLDELTTAPPAVQAALLRAVVDRAFGDLELDPAKVFLIAAANPPGIAAGGWDLAPPLANRFTHLHFTLDTDVWTSSFPGYWDNPPALSYGDGVLSEDNWQEARLLVAAFVRSRPQLLLAVPEAAKQRGEAWPSPRTWDYFSRLLASARQSGLSPTDALELLSGCVGSGVSLEFVNWHKALDLPDPEELLADPEKYNHPNRADVAYAALSAVGFAVARKPTEARYMAAWRVLARAAEQGGVEVGTAVARRLALIMSENPGWALPVKEILAYAPMLQKAGLLK